MGITVHNYDIDKKNSFISAADNCLQQVSLINNKFSELKSKYSEIYEKSDYCHDVKKYFKSITELIENSKESIKDVYVYAAMANNDTHIQLKELNLKLEIINLELKPLMGISKPECNFNNTNFVDFITPSAEDIFKRIEFYSTGDRWKKLVAKDIDDIIDEEWALLVNIYSNLEVDELDEFFYGFYDLEKRDEGKFEQDGRDCTQYGKHSKWKLDQAKLKEFYYYYEAAKLVQYDELLKSHEKYTFDSNNSEFEKLSLQDDRNYRIMIQRAAVLNTFFNNSFLYADYDAEKPYIKTYKNDTGEILVNYDTYGYMPDIDYMDYYDLLPQQHKISFVLWEDKDFAIDNARNIEKELDIYFGTTNSMVVKDNIKDFALSQIDSKIQDKSKDEAKKLIQNKLIEQNITKIAAEKASSKAVAFIPVIGDIISCFVDIKNDIEEIDKDQAFGKNLADKLKQNAVMDYLNMYAVRIYNNGEEVGVYVQPGKETEKMLSEINKEKIVITLTDALKGNTKTFNTLEKINMKSKTLESE